MSLTAFWDAFDSVFERVPNLSVPPRLRQLCGYLPLDRDSLPEVWVTDRSSLVCRMRTVHLVLSDILGLSELAAYLAIGPLCPPSIREHPSLTILSRWRHSPATGLRISLMAKFSLCSLAHVRPSEI